MQEVDRDVRDATETIKSRRVPIRASNKKKIKQLRKKITNNNNKNNNK